MLIHEHAESLTLLIRCVVLPSIGLSSRAVFRPGLVLGYTLRCLSFGWLLRSYQFYLLTTLFRIILDALDEREYTAEIGTFPKYSADLWGSISIYSPARIRASESDDDGHSEAVAAAAGAVAAAGVGGPVPVPVRAKAATLVAAAFLFGAEDEGLDELLGGVGAAAAAGAAVEVVVDPGVPPAAVGDVAGAPPALDEDIDSLVASGVSPSLPAVADASHSAALAVGLPDRHHPGFEVVSVAG